MKTVLIVDDNILAAKGIEKNINWGNLDAQMPVIKYDSHSALEAIKEYDIDLIISDIEMPNLDGISMCQLALSINPMIKIILISAYDKFEYARRAIRLGASDYIEKPIDYTYLTEKIRSAFHDLDKTRKNLELIRKTRPLMTEKFFSDLLKYPGEDTKTNLGYLFDSLDLDFSYVHYNIMIIEPEFPDSDSDLDFTHLQLELLNILEYLKIHLHAFDDVYYLKEFRSIICIIGSNNKSQQSFLHLVQRTVSDISDCWENDYILNIGVGTVADSLWKLPESYASASHALKYRFFFPHKNIFDARDAMGKDFSLLSFMENSDEELIKLICTKDSEAIEQWLTVFFQKLTGEIQDKNFFFIRIYSLLGRILKFLYEMNLDTADLEAEILNAYKQFDSFKTYEQFVHWIAGLCRTAYTRLDSSMESYHRQIYNIALNYITENYERSDLCLNEIADYANISPAYLSSLFKKVSGQNISDAVTSLRIKSACRYLASTNLSLKEISIRCGYTNQYYFSTSFKKKLGISPSAYREEYS